MSPARVAAVLADSCREAWYWLCFLAASALTFALLLALIVGVVAVPVAIALIALHLVGLL